MAKLVWELSLFALALAASEEAFSMFLECRSCQGFDECVCWQLLSFEVFEVDDLVVDLFNHEV